MKLPIDTTSAITGDDLNYVITGPHSIVAIDGRGNQWPITWANIQTCIEQGGIIPTFSNLNIPERIPYLADVFPKMWNYPQDAIPDGRDGARLFEMVAEIRGDGSGTMQTHDGAEVIKVNAHDPDALRMKIVKTNMPYDPREPMPQLNNYEGPANMIGVQLSPFGIKAKRSAFKPRVFDNNINFDTLNEVKQGLTAPLVSPSVLRKHVRRIFPSQRRVQWTLNGGNFTQLESPLKLIRYLCALGFTPTVLQPTGSLLTARHSIAFLAEYAGSLFGFSTSKVNQYHCWECVMFTTSSDSEYKPYVSPGFTLSSFYNPADYDYNPYLLSMGAFNFIGSRGVPAPLQNIERLAAATSQVPRNHDTRPFRYNLQIRYRWKQVMTLVDAAMGRDYLSSYDWTCYTIPGPALIHKIKWKEMPAMRFTADAMAVIYSKIEAWSLQFQEVQSVYCDFESSNHDQSMYSDDEDNFAETTPFNAKIIMSDTVTTVRQAEIMANFFMELPALMEQVVENDPNGCK